MKSIPPLLTVLALIFYKELEAFSTVPQTSFSHRDTRTDFSTFSPVDGSSPRNLVFSASALLSGLSDETNDTANDKPGIPQLPPPGTTSFGTIPSVANAIPEDEAPPAALVGRKFELQYTCNICDTRNCHKVSRVAYRQGVVITRCKGCDNQHLIADNLGWTDYKGGFEGEVNDIEQFFEENGREDNVNRVSPEVFDLEMALSRDTTCGSIVGEDGKLHME